MINQVCKKCNGEGKISELISYHHYDRYEEFDCKLCKGTGIQPEITIINLTPHTINIYNTAYDDNILVIPSSGQARAEEQKQQIDIIKNIPVYSIKYGNITGLPEPQENTIYIVSQIVASAVPDRNDVYIVSDTVRDSEGKIIGCRALAHV